MNLRAKIILMIAAMMAILYALVVGALLPESVDHQLRAKRELSSTSAQLLVHYLNELPNPKRAAALTEKVQESRLNKTFGFWALRDDQRNIVAGNLESPFPAPLQSEHIDQYNLTIIQTFPIRPGENHPWAIVASVPITGFTLGHELWTLFVPMFMGTLMMGGALYALMLRWVISPIERIVSASRVSASPSALLQKIPHSDRLDEIGSLIRSYNTMAEEVNDLRLNLETRVHNAIQHLESAQKKLVLSERLSATGKLAAGVAHEISNPLGGMLNAVRTLQQKAKPASRESDYLALMLDGLGRIQQIVSTMLQFSRPTEQNSSVDLIEVIDGALLFCQHRIAQQKITLEKDFSSENTYRVTGNRAALGQVFLNLLVNALDAMEAQTNTPNALKIHAIHEPSGVKIVIKDTGTGMSEEVIQHADEPFFSTKAEEGGTGLGLSIVRHIINEHKGDLGFESITGSGTTATVSFPLERPHSSKEKSTEGSDPSEPEPPTMEQANS